MTIERRGRLTPTPKQSIKHNLTGNKYGKYLLREPLEEEIINFIKDDDKNYQIVSGLGGMGKSSLIFSVLSKIINGEIELEKTVDSIIWVTDSYNPGDLSIDKIVREINSVYGNAASTQAYTGSDREKARNHLNLGSNRISILVVDNFETINDEELRRFIFELPQTCKVILTSKLSREACIQSGVIKTQNMDCITDFQIPPFTEDEWRSLFNSICSTSNSISEWANRIDTDTLNEIINVIYTELGGVPFPFERILAQITERQLSDPSKIKNLIRKVIERTGVYDRMITYSWENLDRESQAVLIAAALSGYLSYLNFIQLSFVSGLQDYDDEYSAEIGSELDNAVEQCLDYKLIERDSSGDIVRFYLPAMVYRYVINKIQNDSEINSDFSDVINNWIVFYKKRTKEVGMCFDNTEKMKEFDNVYQREALQFVLDYCYKNSLFDCYVEISNNMRYFYYTRSIWETGEGCVHIKRAHAANMCGDTISELEAYVYYINIASKYRQFDSIERYLSRVQEIVENNSIEEKYPESFFRYRHALGLYHYHRDEYSRAMQIWEELLKEPIKTRNTHDIDAAQRWYTKCAIKAFEQLGTPICELEERISELLKISRMHNFERAIIDYTLMLVKIYWQQGQHDKARQLLGGAEMTQLINRTNDVLYRAKYYLWCAYYSDGEERIQNIRKAKKLAADNAVTDILQGEISAFGDEFKELFRN